MNTVKMRGLVGSGILAISILLTGCGGGGDDAPSAPSPQPPGNPGTLAPANLSGRTYDLQDDGGLSAVAFSSASNYTFRDNAGVVEAGSYSANQSGNTWNVVLQGLGAPRVYALTFGTSNSGSYSKQRQGEQDRNGLFTTRSTPIEPGGGSTDGSTDGTTDGSTNGTTDGSTDGNTNGSTNGNTTGVTPSPDYTGNAPVSIAGRRMAATRRVTSTGPAGQTHIYTFGVGTYHDSDPPEESDGTFSYSANNSVATMTLNYTGPADFVGDRHQITLSFSQKDRGTFESTYTRGDGTTIMINGDFAIDPIP